MRNHMKIETLILVTILLISCQHSNKTNNNPGTSTTQESHSKTETKTNNALKFINAYTENSNKMNKAIGIVEWVNSNKLSTKAFKAELKTIVDEAHKQDPELGLEADPIFDAQDFPDKGFELESFDSNTNYLTVRGMDWPEFKLTMKVTEENGSWLVDGCGMINIPSGKRARR